MIDQLLGRAGFLKFKTTFTKVLHYGFNLIKGIILGFITADYYLFIFSNEHVSVKCF